MPVKDLFIQNHILILFSSLFGFLFYVLENMIPENYHTPKKLSEVSFPFCLCFVIVVCLFLTGSHYAILVGLEFSTYKISASLC